MRHDLRLASGREDTDVSKGMSLVKHTWPDGMESVDYVAHHDPEIRLAHVKASYSDLVNVLDDVLNDIGTSSNLIRALNDKKVLDYYLQVVGEGSFGLHPSAKTVSFDEAEEKGETATVAISEYMARCASKTFIADGDEPWDQQIMILGSEKSPAYTDACNMDVSADSAKIRLAFAVVGCDCEFKLRTRKYPRNPQLTDNNVEADLRLRHGDFLCLSSTHALKYTITRKGFGILMVGRWAQQLSQVHMDEVEANWAGIVS
ncbi:hypothetical protein FRB99_007833 [Tulasnella sp. 403]|nr:hypothetical protein FRB99_007833 [Tulasnella sp. 403]